MYTVRTTWNSQGLGSWELGESGWRLIQVRFPLSWVHVFTEQLFLLLGFSSLGSFSKSFNLCRSDWRHRGSSRVWPAFLPPAGQESVAHAVPALPVGRSLVLSEQRERRGHVKPELARTGEAEMVASWFLPEAFTLLSASVSRCC